ncbi:hypothetical protein AX15_004888 [Amanita polypyramis BW_CC]|nr:hypothetical protein AX15_004888 [Amanita polypyramis BW_CC]
MLPPLRIINHEIPLINPNLKIVHRAAKCPEPLRDELKEKVDRYLNAGCWIRTELPSSAPLMIAFKKSGKIRTVVDARQRNDNTLSDSTPMPDQETIRNNVARAKFRSKIDLSDAYEQIRISPEHEPRTTFLTIYSNMISRVMQQGDKNGPATFQKLMNYSFSDMSSVFIHCYQDNIFVYSNTLEEHEQHLQKVFDCLRELRLYLSRNPEKIDIFSLKMDCLGFIVDDEGIHIDPSKIDKIVQWRTPRNYQDVLRFNGVIQYLAQYIPKATEYTAPLTGMCSNNRDFVWTDFHDLCFKKLKSLVEMNIVCRPINGKLDVPIWVITDASATGVGCWYGQGPTWDTIWPTGFFSWKFTPAQMNYCTWEQELLGVLEALLCWEDKLLGLPFTVVTDHQALTFFNEAPTRSHRRTQWWEYLSRFNFKMEYLKGEKNVVADALSRYFASNEPGKTHDVSAYVNADFRLDPERNDLTIARTAELIAFKVDAYPNSGRKELVCDHIEQRAVEAQQLSQDKETGVIEPPNINPLDGNFQSIFKTFPAAYSKDKFLAHIWEHTDRFNKFMKQKDLLWTNNRMGLRVICVPDSLLKGKSLKGLVLEACHQTIGHLGAERTLKYARCWFWWASMAEDVDDFCKSCGKCQTTKRSRQKSPGWLHSMPFPSRPWESIGMDFVGPFVEVNNFNYILLVEIVRLHGIPESIVSDCDTKFMSQFWTELSKILGQRLLMSSSYHPQTDGSSERAIQTMSQILQSVVNDYQTNWVEQLPLVEFAMNSAHNATTGHAPFEANYGWLPCMIRGTSVESSREGVKRFVERITGVLDKIYDNITIQRTRQARQANKHRRDGQEFQKDSLVLLSMENINLPRGRARKLCLKFIGPFRIIKAYPESSTYKLELSPDLVSRKMHDVFHEKLLKLFVGNNPDKFPKRESHTDYNVGVDPKREWVVEAIEDHKWMPRLKFKVRWALGDFTWEPLHVVNDLEALDHYLELEGVTKPSELRRV